MAVITVTERAMEKIKELCHHNNKYAVRLSIKGGGCAGYSYDWGFAHQSEIAPEDQSNHVSQLDNMNGAD